MEFLFNHWPIVLALLFLTTFVLILVQIKLLTDPIAKSKEPEKLKALGDERYYQSLISRRHIGPDCQLEYRLVDSARVDILTPKYAIEVDWAHKWAESVGQALYYGIMTKRTAVSLLLVKPGENADAFISRIRVVKSHYPIDLWVYDIETDKLTKVQ